MSDYTVNIDLEIPDDEASIDVDLQIIDEQEMEYMLETIGPRGPVGATPNLQIGTVQSVPPTQNPEVTITGTAENPFLNFKLKQGEKGEKGDKGDPAPATGTLRVIPFSIGVSSWSLVDGYYVCNFATEYVTASSVEFVEYTDSFRNAIRGDLSWSKTNGGGGVTFRSSTQPIATLVGEIKTIDRDDEAIAVTVQQTAWPTMRNVPFTLLVSDWTLNSNTGKYEAVFESPFITATSHDFVEFDESFEHATDGIQATKAIRTGATVGMKFITRSIPEDTITGVITPLDNADGKVVIALEDTVVSVANGGTGANTLAGAKHNLGIDELRNGIDEVVEKLKAIYDLTNYELIYETASTYFSTGTFTMDDSVNNYDVIYAEVYYIGADQTEFCRVGKFVPKNQCYISTYGQIVITGYIYGVHLGAVIDLEDDQVKLFNVATNSGSWNGAKLRIYGLKL